jgi:hypothetical protein
VVPISAALLSGGEAHLLTLVDLLTEGMEKGVYVRWPHPKEADNRSGLCKGCPTPAICRGWPEAETLRFADHEKMRLLHIARAIDALEGDE